ncbi:hypothetical protein SAMN04489730_0948 [Amycolatopsis australiensis]|uniref:DUF3307 domain-containing protein n=2 Tax=Amycolatopsis australiensis TaxID=546364 RepID=A0A1K1PS29_9PSEU|nr:hypothetical protein SAMN04489730_0948 [Amycolatopsis australiensis]
MPELMTLVTFAASWVVLSVGHTLADHVGGQTDRQAARKGAPTAAEVAAGASPRRGWAANLAHVAQYHAVLMLLGFAAWLALPLPWSTRGVLAALVWSAGTHAFLDRRWPVRWLLNRLRQGRFARQADNGLNGMYLADQALHGLALGIAAVALAVIP